MAKKKKLMSCPYCGSKNLQIEGYSSKGRQIVQCAECDETFEVRSGGDKRDHERHREKESETW